MRIPIFFVTLLFLVSCRNVEEQVELAQEENLMAFMEAPSSYILDESFDIFLQRPWYTYDQGNHIIWPIFEVYALKTKNKYYKLQVVDYYDSQNNPGIYNLRIKEEEGKEELFTFEAKGCGNVYTNLNYKECVSDTTQNIYTYLNVESLETWKMTDRQAKKNLDWDIAFSGTDFYP